LRAEEETEICFSLLEVNCFPLLDISTSSGTRNSGDILLYDVRQKDCIVKFQSHRQEVCGLKWCPNGRYLASGSNDNTVCVWDFHQWSSTGGTSATLSSLLPPTNGEEKPSMCQTKPLWHFKDHKAAVKVNSTCGLTRMRGCVSDRLWLGVRGKDRKSWQQVVVIPMVIYVFGTIAMEHVSKL
jgi:WD40 repeat protein